MSAVKGWATSLGGGVGTAVLVLYNVAVFLVFAWDKWRARQGGRRVPERVLLWLAALCGAAGACLGTYGIHHKTRKPRFALGVPAMLAGQVALLVWVVDALG